MKQVCGLAVTVKASGVSEAYYNGQRDRVVEAVKVEMARQRAELEEQLRIERDRADIKEARLNHALAENLKRMHERRRRSVLRRALENAWAMLWAMAHCWAEMGETLGLWEIIREDDAHDA